MNKLFSFIKRNFAEIMIVIGIALFIYNAFSFNFYSRIGSSREFYYYSQSSLNMMTLGAVLVASGLLIIKNKK